MQASAFGFLLILILERFLSLYYGAEYERICAPIPWFTIADVRNQGRFINYTEQSITDQAISKNSERIIPKDSILLR